MTNEERSLLTKKSLAEALKLAMKHKNLSKITVSELIRDCNLNRKTFYYHFSDIYDLLKWTLDQEAIDVVKNFDLLHDTEEAIRFVVNYIETNDYIINGALDSMGYEEIKRFFHKDLYSIFYAAIDSSEQISNVSLDPKFKYFLSDFYTEASAGLLLEWSKNRLEIDKESIIQNILSIFKISIPIIIHEKHI